MRKRTSSDTEQMSDACVTAAVGERVAAWLRQVYPDARAKRIARDFGCDERTAQGWLAGAAPANKHWHGMVARWGQRFLAFVYQPHFDWAEQARLDAELEALVNQLRERRKGSGDGD